MADDVNPWDVATWNLTKQAAYIQQYGIERAKARAHDAGTTLGAARQRPVVPIVRPNYIFQKRITNVTSGGGSSPLLDGHGPPSDALGVNDNLYIDIDTGNVYLKSGGTWS